tara:strand:+ start:107 stop:988 length:882 start_codon:yes stop_codon:yes gene_type:complete
MDFKPRPYTKREFLDKLVMPYDNPETKQEVFGNPNQIDSVAKPGQPDSSKVDRAAEISVKNDTNKDFKITLKDIDESILYYLQNVIKPSVMQNDSKLGVPIIYGSPERWKSMQSDGFYRDKNGKTMVPLIMFKRTSFEKDNTLGNKLDGNRVQNVQYFETQYSKRNNYDNFSILQNQKPQKEYILGVIPDYITISYDMSIFTDFTEQMNEITEAIEFSARSYWGDPQRFMFRADIKSFATPTLLEAGVDRANKTTMTLTVNAYIIPKTINAKMAGPSPKSYSVVKTVFGEQII